MEYSSLRYKIEFFWTFCATYTDHDEAYTVHFPSAVREKAAFALRPGLSQEGNNKGKNKAQTS
jgi:hypothetical protein